MKRAAAAVKRFIFNDAGATAAEYAVMLALIIVVCLAAIAALGEKVSTMYVDIETNMP